MATITDQALCCGCGQCVKECQNANIVIADGKSTFAGTTCIECGHCAAVCPTGAINVVGADKNDLLLLRDLDRQVNPDVFFNFVRSRRAIRQFKPDPVPEDVIRRIIELGRYTQTGANLQRIRFIVLTGEKKKEIAKQAITFLGENDIQTFDKSKLRVPPFYFALGGVLKSWYQIYQQTGVDMLLHDAPCQLIVVSSFGNEYDSMLSAGHMELYANMLGLGTCFTGFATFAYQASRELQKELGIGEGEIATISMTFGYPNVEFTRTTYRKPANLTIL